MSLTPEDREFLVDLFTVVLKYPTLGLVPAAQQELADVVKRAEEREKAAVADMYGRKL